ncbi:MAG TPA: primosomal protein N' [Nitrosomonas sp.]|nr:primosomal protein N' [Nitrosomonas sp.]
MTIVRVALNVPIDSLFDYRLPDASLQDIGRLVRVPFGKRRMVGVIVERVQDTQIKPEQLKAVDEVLRSIPPLPALLLKLFIFCNHYYHHPIGMIAMGCLPAKLAGVKSISKINTEQTFFMLTEAGRLVSINTLPVRDKAQRSLLTQLQTVGTLTSKQAKAISRRAPQLIALFLTRAWIEERHSVTPSIQPKRVSMPTLNAEQADAVKSIVAELHQFKTWLLHGITGSGKTEVYLQVIAAVLQQDRQVLILVPEINLTPQLEKGFRDRFPALSVICLHSKLNTTERTQNWLLAQAGTANIVLGTRLSIFTPLPKLGLIIVDEEHDPSYKQQDGFRYSARDVAIFRAKQTGVPIVLGSATPSLESYHNAVKGRYSLLTLRTRAIKNAALPVIQLIDTRSKLLQEGLSEPMLNALEKNLAQNKQSMVFINRRGYAPILLCKSCAWMATCSRCSSRLVFHLQKQLLCCHYCGHQQPSPHACPHCGDPDLLPFGQGTQRIEAAIAKHFSSARIVRVDRDNISRKGAWAHIRQAIQAQQVDILIGTQLLAKGHDFPELSLVCILNADASLYSTDFRAEERLFSQLMQVAGRAGRAAIVGTVLIQTEIPDHPLYAALIKHDYDHYAKKLLKERQTIDFPPYAYQALLNAEAPKLDSALNFLKNALTITPLAQSMQIYDPVPAQMPRLKGYERAHVLIQSHSRKKLQDFLANWYTELLKIKKTKVRWTIDVDPLEF